MSDSTIRQRIFEIISGASPIAEASYASASFGIVHKYERWAKDWDKFIQLFKDGNSNRILGCEICRASSVAVKISNLEEENTHGYMVRFYMGVKDDDQTEILFNDKIDALKALFRHNHDLDGACLAAGPMSATIIDVRFFGGVLCHYAELHLPAVEII